MTHEHYPAPTVPGAGGKFTGVHLAMAALAGGFVIAIGAVVLLPKLAQAPGPAPAAAFSASKEGVSMKPAEVPMQFDTALVELGAPLARNPVTARVATLESLTGPSFAPLEGRVIEVKVRIGDRVKKDDKMILVRSGELASMNRELRAAQLSIQTKQTLAERLRILVESRAASQNDLMVAVSELNEAKLTASAAGAKIRSLNVKQDGETSYWVLATRTGTVVQLDVAAGKQVGPSDKEKPVATVAELNEVLVVGDVSQREAATLAPGMAVIITEPGAAGQAPLEGIVEVVSDTVDSERQTVPIRIRVKNEQNHLRPNEFVEASFAASSADRVLRVPTEAIVSDGAISVVFVQVSPGVLKRRPVKTGRANPTHTEIKSGVAVGERVVVRGALLLLNAIDVKG